MSTWLQIFIGIIDCIQLQSSSIVTSSLQQQLRTWMISRCGFHTLWAWRHKQHSLSIVVATVSLLWYKNHWYCCKSLVNLWLAFKITGLFPIKDLMSVWKVSLKLSCSFWSLDRSAVHPLALPCSNCHQTKELKGQTIPVPGQLIS